MYEGLNKFDCIVLYAISTRIIMIQTPVYGTMVRTFGNVDYVDSYNLL